MYPLVSTKLRPSQSRPKLVARPRLAERLDPEAGRRLTLVSAPAGFGKTTLLVKWAKEQADKGRPVAWLSLDDDDNDPARFLAYLAAAIRRGTDEQGFGEGVLAALRSPEPPRMEAVLGVLVNEMSSMENGLDLVLDDYHLVEDEGVHGIVSFLLDHLPENVHLVVSGRVDPPLPLAKLRARGQMVRLGASDLAFTREEAAAFLWGVMGLDLSEEDLARLERRTEGWIAGLQLAALSMQGRTDLPAFVESFSGGHRDVLDFLADEVLARQPEQMREFLLKTSILNSLTGPLCDALTGRSDGQRTLERLERENLFVVALDDERVWYRYHHLFAEFLRGRLRRESPGRVGELHLEASNWSERNGDLYTAVEQALAAGDNQRAARLMERGLGQTWYRGEVATLLGWLGRLPGEAMRDRPLLLIWYAAALMLIGGPEGVEALLDEVESGIGAGEDPDYVLATAASVRSQHARRLGRAREAVAHARRALSLLPEDNLNRAPSPPSPWPTLSWEQLGQARLLLARDEPREALRLLVERYGSAKTAGAKIPLLTLQALALRTLVKRERAVGILAEALALAEPEGYVRIFVDEGPQVAELLSEVLEGQCRGHLDSPVPAHYLRKLLAALERDAEGAASSVAGLSEPPSERELEVLQLLAAGLSNRRIASDLFISVGTVKTHVNNLYRKLEAHNRTQAVARAREMGLL